MEFIYQYSLFLAKTVTVVVVIAAIVAIFSNLRPQKHSRTSGKLNIVNLNEKYEATQENLCNAILQGEERKVWEKAEKKKQKDEKQQEKKAKEGVVLRKPCLYVLSFTGSMDAHEVSGLREEITAILGVIQTDDEVLLQLESPGGVVHGYGLAASQLVRLKNQGIPLTVVVDKVAASGGYMMACVADKIIAAPFAIIGSIGVVAQLPNFHRLLKKRDIDIELHTAGEYKRTLTMFGENDKRGREKFQSELDEIHQMFKDFVQQHRTNLNINAVATGEHWFGTHAKKLGLVDDIATSDDVIFSYIKSHKVVALNYDMKKKVAQRLAEYIEGSVNRVILRLWQKSERPLL